MKKAVIVSVVAALLVTVSMRSPVLAQIRSERELRGYIGPVRSVRTYVVEYDYESKRPHKGKRRKDLAEDFDRDGNLLREISYGDDADILSDETYRYESGRLLEMTRKHSPFTYLADKVVYIHGPHGQIAEEKGYNSNGTLVNDNVYEYDSEGRKIQWTSRSFFEHEDHRAHRWTYRYDDQGRRIEERAFVEAGGSFVATDELGGPHRSVTTYRDQATRSGSTERFNSLGSLVGSYVSTYDAKGNELEDIRLDASGHVISKTRYEYLFDRVGNWTLQKTLEWSEEKAVFQLTELTSQKIAYYPQKKRAVNRR